MSVDVAEYQKLKTIASKAKQDADRAQGALETHMDTLKRVHGCKTVVEAKEKLEGLRRNLEVAEQAYERELAAFKEEWGERLGI